MYAIVKRHVSRVRRHRKGTFADGEPGDHDGVQMGTIGAIGISFEVRNDEEAGG